MRIGIIFQNTYKSRKTCRALTVLFQNVYHLKNLLQNSPEIKLFSIYIASIKQSPCNSIFNSFHQRLTAVENGEKRNQRLQSWIKKSLKIKASDIELNGFCKADVLGTPRAILKSSRRRSCADKTCRNKSVKELNTHLAAGCHQKDIITLLLSNFLACCLLLSFSNSLSFPSLTNAIFKL